jgi:hypothetical protein
MNKSLSVFLSVLLCVVLYVGVLLLRYTTDKSDYWQSSQVYTSSAPAGAPSVSFGVGANGDVLAVPMSSRYSSRERYLQPSWRSTGVANLQVFSRSANSTGMLSHPSLQGGDGGMLFTHMSSSQTMKSFGGGSNAAGVSMSGGVVSTNNQSPIANNQLPVLNLPSPMFASQQMLADAPALAMYEDMSAPRGMAGRRDVPSIGGGTDVSSTFMNILTTICDGSPNLSLTDAELKAKWLVVYPVPGTAPCLWGDFLAWYQSVRTLPEGTPIGDAVPVMLLLSCVFVVYTYIQRKKINTI